MKELNKSSYQHAVTVAKPTVYVLATGGTILCSSTSEISNHYSSPSLHINDIIFQIPQISDFETVKTEQLTNIISQEQTTQDLIYLARKINNIASSKPISGIVVVQGTNTIEEVTYFTS